MPAPFNHSSGLAGVFDRTPDKPDWARVLFREGQLSQAAELMELQSMIEGRGRRVADRMMSDGYRVSGADIIVEIATGAVTLSSGQIYLRGDVRDVPAAALAGVTMTGDIVVGVRLVRSVVTEVQDPDLLGLQAGSVAEGEPGAGREKEVVLWGWSGDGQTGDLYQVYALKDGIAVDQTPPPVLSGVSQALALYDRQAHGSYVVNGCRVSALGKIAGAQHFSIAEGVANILGFKRTHNFSIRHTEAEVWDVATVDAEPHSFTDSGGGTAVITINHGPLDVLTTAIVTKEVTASMTKGATGSLDILPNASVASVISVVQGATTYIAATDYVLNADKIDWTPGGEEPAQGSTYSVTYRFLDAVVPTSTTDDTVTLAGGVTGDPVLLTYNWKLPRTDLICFEAAGLPVYVKGVSSAVAPQAPAQPTALLALAEVANNWRTAPTILNTDVRSVPFSELWHYIRKLWDALDLISLERLRRDVDSREPVAKKGMFVDPWESDFYRDAGTPQTGAIFGGQMQLAIDATVHSVGPTAPVALNFTDEIVLRQELATACMKINPYANFTPLPGALALNPATDFWTEFETQWLSPITQKIGEGDIVGRTSRVQLVSDRTETLQYLRQTAVAFTVSGFGAGELLTSLTFDGLDVTPLPALAATGAGEVTGSFVIPANVPAGTKSVVALGAGETSAAAEFSGQGTVDVLVMRRVSTITRFDIGGHGPDPLAQTFALSQPRAISGVDLHFCAVGAASSEVLVEIHPVENGLPAPEVLAQAVVDMTTVVAGSWVPVRFGLPVYLPADRQFAIMVKTDDAAHSLSIGRVGDFDATSQRWVGAQPYSIGVLLSSSNAQTWTPHQNEDLTFRLVAAKFSPVSKTVNLGSVAVSNMSDVLIMAGIEQPTGDATVHFEVERADGQITKLFAGQPWALDAFLNETVLVRAILTGTATISPVLYPGTLLVSGALRASGTYISRAFEMGAAIRMSAFLKSKLPQGSGLTVEVDATDDVWSAVAQQSSNVLNNGWVEQEFRVLPYTATTGRVRLTLTGTPAARPALSDMRAVAI